MKRTLLTSLLAFAISAAFSQNVGIGTSSPNSTLDVGGSSGSRMVVAAGNITLGNFSTIICNDITTINVPAASADNANRIYRIVARANVQLGGASVLQIGSQQSLGILTRGTAVTIQSSGTQWYQVD